MYIPKHFEESRSEVLYNFIREHPFAVLVTHTDAGLEANHLPVYLNINDETNPCLQGHIASANPLWELVSELSRVLLIFQGNNAYISPAWLPSKTVNGKVVPTWNYTAVHVKGSIRFIHDASWKLKLIEDSTLAQEQTAENPWSVSDAPAEFIEKLLPAIVGFEIAIEEISGKFKLSQNQPEENRRAIAAALEQQGHGMAKQIAP